MKKFLAILLVGLMSVALLTACSDDSSASEPDTITIANTDFTDWTKEDWEAASSAEQSEAADYVLFELGDSFIDGYSDLVKAARSDESAAAQLEEATEQLKESIGNYLDQVDGSTIGSLIEQSQSVIAAAVQ